MNKQTNQSHANGIDSLSLTLILAAVVFLLLGKLAVFFFFLAALCLALYAAFSLGEPQLIPPGGGGVDATIAPPTRPPTRAAPSSAPPAAG